jgi:hypothetical protein
MPMTIGAALALIAVGAILRFAITTPVNGIAIPTIGLILMIIGAIGVVLWLIFWSPWARRRRVVYREGVPPEEVVLPARRRPVVYREAVPPEEAGPPARRRRVFYREDVPPEEVPPARRYPADTGYEDEYPR